LGYFCLFFQRKFAYQKFKHGQGFFFFIQLKEAEPLFKISGGNFVAKGVVEDKFIELVNCFFIFTLAEK